MKNYTEEEIEELLEDEGIEFESLYDFLIAHKDLKMNISFDAPIFTIQMELEDM